MSSATLSHELYERLPSSDGAFGFAGDRSAHLDRFFALSSGREKPGRFWRVDFERIVPDAKAVDLDAPAARVVSGGSGLLVCDLPTAAREHPELLARAFQTTDIAATKFGALAAAFVRHGIFIYARADQECDEPVVIAVHAPDGTAIFPWNVVLAERGARVTVFEKIDGGAEAFICGATEVVTEEHASVVHSALQQSGQEARIVWNRAARPGRGAAMAWSDAELGGRVAASDISVSIEQPGAEAEVTTLFFPRGSEHVDVISTVNHRAGEATSETLVKSAATDRGQARFLGNIRIAPHAQGSDARLRDDALLLSRSAHVDSVPALEIGANDVKAYHGATVGAIDAEQIFYMESRGIERTSAERMIALGFFEPAIERFPTTALRDEIRALLAAKLA